MKLNEAGIDLIKSFESLRLNAYPDPGTGAEPYTIGYGHTDGVSDGDSIDQATADQYLQDDLSKFIQGVTDLVTIDLTDNQFSALVSFSFNCGLHNLATSTLLKHVNSGKHDELAEFEMWDKAAGKEMAGLLRRRKAEANLFMTEDS